VKKLQKPREIPRKTDGTPNPIYFELEVDGIDPQWFRIPNDRIISELITLLADFASLDDAISFEGSIDVLAAFVGVSWWGSDYAIETQQPRRGGDWLAFGEDVLEEFHEHGLGGTTHIARWAAELAKRFGAALVSPEQMTAFGEAQKVSGTLSDWTSA